jgi:hypothetical protein
MCSGLQLSIPRREDQPAYKSFHLSKLQVSLPLDWKLLCLGLPQCGRDRILRMNVTTNMADGRKPRRTMLPLLVVLFVISYGMLTLLVLLQDRTLDSQRGLIHLLFQDSVRLSALMHRPPAVHQEQQTTSEQNTGNQQASKSHPPSSQAPSVQGEKSQNPQSQAKPQTNGKVGRYSKKADKANPTRPPVELTDPSDMRRVSFSI